METQLNYFLLSFKVDGEVHVEGIYAPTFSMAKDKLRLYFPDCCDVHHVENQPHALPLTA